MDNKVSFTLLEGCQSVNLPNGEPLSTLLPSDLIGDVLEVWNFFCSFYKPLGLQEPLSFDGLVEELIGSWADGANGLEKFTSGCPKRENSPAYSAKSVKNGISRACASMMKALLSELQATHGDVRGPSFGNKQLKQKLGRENEVLMKVDMPPVNELTWEELARRYALAVSCINGGLQSTETTIPFHRCLYGDGGLLCGSLTGVAAIEADAKVLAMATKKIFGSLKGPDDYLTILDVDSNEKDSSQNLMEAKDIPDWAQELIPVKKCPTNNGSMIKKCVNAALGRCPPDQVKIDLENSISKEVYKGNSCGASKRAIIKILLDREGLCSKTLQQMSASGKGKTKLICISDIIMKQCRVVLRRVAARDKTLVFCNLARGLESPAMVSRSIDLRMIDARLAAGSYGGLHEAFAEDVRELWRNVRTAFGHKPDMVQLADTLSLSFESLYDKEVVTTCKRLKKYAKSKLMSADIVKDIELLSSNTIPKAPWEVGICKVCGIDIDDDKVLLCDACDAEYHTYCLSPPLNTIPEDKWYCPNCIGDINDSPQMPSRKCVISPKQRSNEIELGQIEFNAIAHIAAMMREKEYSMLCTHEKTLLLKFFCDEMLDSCFVHQHVDECVRSAHQLRQHMRRLNVKLKTLKQKERVLGTYEKELGACYSSSEPSLPMEAHELASNREELKIVRNEIRLVMSSKSKLKFDLKEQFLRAEFLGVDYIGRLYWVIDSIGHPYIIIAKKTSKDSQQKSSVETSASSSSSSDDRDLSGDNSNLSSDNKDLSGALDSVEHPSIIIAEETSKDCQQRCSVESSASGSSTSGNNNLSRAGDSDATCPIYEDRYKNAAHSWVCCQSDAEIQNIISFLKDDNALGRHLKKSIMCMRRLPPHTAASRSENFSTSNRLLTYAFRLLETQYGPLTDTETIYSLKGTNNEEIASAERLMHRCLCLEPIKPTAEHCLFCHNTFFRENELKMHKRSCSIEDALKDMIAGIVNASVFSNTAKDGHGVGEMDTVDNISVAQIGAEVMNLGNGFEMPSSSLKPVVGEAVDVLRQLKMNLLDMEAALPEGAIRSSKACFRRRRAWRMFVKCARTIYEIVLASLAFEEMIKLEYLKRKWWYLPSPSTAAKISTLSALSLLIYSLDASIIYNEIPSIAAPHQRNGKSSGEKRKNDRGSSSTEELDSIADKKRKKLMAEW